MVIPSIVLPVVASGPPVTGESGGVWERTQPLVLAHDVPFKRAASEKTQARILSDGTYLYVRFDAQQSTPIVASQRANGVGADTDDYVQVDLWPGGRSGFLYQFAANPIGTHYQYSSENASFEPAWQSAGTIESGGYRVTMKIPIGILRGSRNAPWEVQFIRKVHATGEVDVWSWTPDQSNADDVTRAGTLTGLSQLTALRPKPRVGVYVLGSAAGQSAGGSTSRSGADVSMPLTAQTSFIASIHPDDSNVDLDQQTIAPTAFARSIGEVRPFFTQGAQHYNPFNCWGCGGLLDLYTPSIPTPRDGYAVEGKEGSVDFGAFDAVGDARNDAAAAVGYATADTRWRFGAQHESVMFSGVRDDVTTTGLSYSDTKHFGAYFNYGTDAGSNVLDGARAQRYDGGAFYVSPLTELGVAIRKTGEYYNPVDGFVPHPDTAGYTLYGARGIVFPEGSPIREIQIGGWLHRYHDHTGALDDTANNVFVDVLTRSLFEVALNTGSGYVANQPGPLVPASQAGIALIYHSGSQTGVDNGAYHGLGSTPTNVSFNTGRFGPGKLDSWTRSTTLRVGLRGTLTLEADDTVQYLDTGARNVQWLERAAYSYGAGPNDSLAIGIRRVIGVPPQLTSAQAFQSGWNVSVSYHRLRGPNELYLVYGDANAFATVPQFIAKWIRYFGAEKGT